jgi:hypothetical protein
LMLIGTLEALGLHAPLPCCRIPCAYVRALAAWAAPRERNPADQRRGRVACTTCPPFRRNSPRPAIGLR